MNNINLKNNLVIIGPSYMKKNTLKDIDFKYNVKYIDEYELKDKYLYKYKEDVCVYLNHKYHMNSELSHIILNYLYEIDINKTYSTTKLNKLVEIKKDLINNKYIIEDNNFKKYLNNKDILVLDNSFDAVIKKMIKELELTNKVNYLIDSEIKKENIDIYEFKTLDEEVSFTASKIVTLVNSGIDISKIKINKLDSAYKAPLSRIFNFYNIPYQDNINKLYTLEDTKKILNLLNKDTKINSINEILDNLDINEKIKNKIISLFNKYVDYDNYNEIEKEFIYDLKHTSIILNNYTNVIKEIDYKSYLPNDDEYIFLMGVNQDYIPVIYKDDNYLSDKELNELGSDTSYTLNKKENDYLIKFINNTKNIFISYKLSSNFNEYNKPSFIKELSNITVINKEYEYDNDSLNKIILGTYLDNYIKYNEILPNLNELYSYYKDINYNSYDNNYKKININTIKKELDNKLNLSFTNTNTFFRCKFRFLLNTIYKLELYEETISQKIGEFFHEVLCILYKENKDLEDIINEVVNNKFPNPTKKELFYIEKYKVIIRKLVDNLNNQLERTNYKNTYFEEWFSIDKTNDLNFKIVGKIDKILTLKDNYNTYVIVIDYKTGSMHSDFNKVIYGFDMQLLYYLYLIKNTNKIDNPYFTGMYLQSIMSEVLTSDKNKTYEELEQDNMKLYGYTVSDIAKLYDIDKDYSESSYIKGLKVKKDGTYYQYSKVLSEDVINELIDIVDKNINSVIDSVKNSEFTIDPKKIGNDLIGCEYCPFKDICFMNNDNIVELEEYKDLEFLGGDNSDTN